MFNLLSLPRVSWKVRLVFAVLAAMFICLIVQQWPHRHDDVALARWMVWFFIVSGFLYLPRMLVVVALGRLPTVYAGMWRSWNRTLPQIHAAFAREQQEQRERSREL